MSSRSRVAFGKSTYWHTWLSHRLETSAEASAVSNKQTNKKIQHRRGYIEVLGASCVGTLADFSRLASLRVPKHLPICMLGEGSAGFLFGCDGGEGEKTKKKA